MILDIKSIFQTLYNHDVLYILVGSLGAIAHGARLQTADMDICIDTNAENLHRIGQMLSTVNAQLLRIPARGIESVNLADWTTLHLDDPAEHHLFSTPYGEIDILPQPFGSYGWDVTTNYSQLLGRSVTNNAFGLKIPVAAFDDIAEAKRALARPQDLMAEAELQRVEALIRSHENPNHGLEQYYKDMQIDQV